MTYDEEESRRFASLASVTYCDDLTHVFDWTCVACKDSKTRLTPGQIRIVDAGDHNATRILVGKLTDQPGCLVSFRGSDNVFNCVRDFQTWEVVPKAFEGCSGCKVHAGFYDIWNNVRDDVLKALTDVGCDKDGKDMLYVTGHSLGAALTHIAMFTLENHGWHVTKTYSFEAPRIGNKVFTDVFADRFARRFPVFRITHSQDPVPHLPPEFFGYTHVQTEVYYNKTGGYRVCPNQEDTACADQYWDVPDMVAFHSGDHCHSPLVPTGDICNPVGCAKATVPSSTGIVV